MNEDQYTKAKSGAGFIAALDQSGGSTPKALKLYGIAEDTYSGDDADVRSGASDARPHHDLPGVQRGSRSSGAILFEATLDRTIEARPTANYLWT